MNEENCRSTTWTSDRETHHEMPKLVTLETKDIKQDTSKEVALSLPINNPPPGCVSSK